jgi:hypothetical protein
MIKVYFTHVGNWHETHYFTQYMLMKYTKELTTIKTNPTKNKNVLHGHFSK